MNLLLCRRCNKNINPVLKDIANHGENALIIKIDGGYAQFIDTFGEDNKQETTFVLCHECGHDFMTNFMKIPAEKYSSWHPNTGDDYCEGWSHA